MADEENDPIIIETVKCPDDSVIPYKANIATPTNLEQLRFHYQQELKAIERSFQSLIDSLECVEWEIPNYTLEDEDVTERNDCFDICCYIFEEPSDGTGGTPCKEYSCSALDEALVQEGFEIAWGLARSEAVYDWPFADSRDLTWGQDDNAGVWGAWVASPSMKLDWGAGTPGPSGYFQPVDMTNWSWYDSAKQFAPCEATDDVITAMDVECNDSVVHVTPPVSFYGYAPQSGSSANVVFTGYQGGDFGKITFNRECAGRYGVTRGGSYQGQVTTDVFSSLAAATSGNGRSIFLSGGTNAGANSVELEIGDIGGQWINYTFSESTNYEILYGQPENQDTVRIHVIATVSITKQDGGGGSVTLNAYSDHAYSETGNVVVEPGYTTRAYDWPGMFEGRNGDEITIAHLAMGAGGGVLSFDLIGEAFLRTFKDYTDPNPNCGQSTGAVQVAVVPEEGQILAWSEKHQCYLPIDNCCPPICTEETITYPPLTPCKEYECDAYGQFISGAADYYWECNPETNPVEDGYLDGSFRIDVTGQPRFSTPHDIIPDSCGQYDSWKNNISSGQGSGILDATEMMPFQYQNVLTYSMIYRNGGGTTDSYLADFRFIWKHDNQVNESLVIFRPFIQGDAIACAIAGNQTTPGILVSGALPDPTNNTYAVMWEMHLPPSTVLDGDTGPVEVVLYVDFVEVGRVHYDLEFYNGVGDSTYYPAPQEEAGGGGANMWLIWNTDNYFAHLAVGGAIDVDLAKEAWARNQSDYVDPNPDCGETQPPVTVPTGPQDGDILVYDKENECLKYTGIDLDVDDVIDDTRTALDTTWSSSKIQQQLDDKKDAGESVRWRYDGWQTGEVYYRMDMTYDGPWLGVARRETTDRLAPQAIGEPFYLYDTDNTVTEQTVAKQVIFGQRYAVSNGGWLNGYRVYTVVGNNYTVYSVIDPLGAPRINTLVSFEASSTGWQLFSLSPIVIAAGDSFDLVVVVAEPDPSPIVIQGNWDYQKPQNPGVPADGEIIHSGREPDIIDISVIDNDGADRGTELRGLDVGDLMYITGGIQWAVQLVTDNVTYVSIVVAPAVQSVFLGVQEFNFETVSPTPISYQREVDRWVGIAEVQGLFGADLDYASIIPDDNQYGADLLLQEGQVSLDWDIYGSTNTASTASAGKSLQDEQDFFDLLSQTGSGGVSQRVDRVEDMLHKLVGALRDLRDE